MAMVTRQRIRLGLRSSGISMTVEEFDDLPDSAFDRHLRYELIRGVLIVTPPAGNAEMDPNEELGHLLWFYRETDPRAVVIDKALPEQTIYSTPNRRRADRAIWTNLGRVPDPEKDIPTILIEFVSPSKKAWVRDYEEKRAEYLGIGVREYWIIDRFARIMTVYRNGPDGVVTLVFPGTASYQTDLLPGFTLPIARLLAKADDWPPKKRTPRRRPSEGDLR